MSWRIIGATGQPGEVRVRVTRMDFSLSSISRS